MRLYHAAAGLVLALVSGTAAMEIPADHYLWGPSGQANYARMTKRDEAPPPTTYGSYGGYGGYGSCRNSRSNRQCWLNDYSINTDFDKQWPTTGRTRYYTLNVVNTTCNPDGSSPRLCQLFNYQYPGPTIEANWGDNIEITVNNKLQYNGTSIHWHGIRQYYTNDQDGVNGITECPLAPGDSKVYRFKATQYGTTWYHSHHGSQYGNGLVGAIKINGPTSANYDNDLGPLVVSDWYYDTGDQVEAIAAERLNGGGGGPPSPDNLVVGGVAKSPSGTGSYQTYKIRKGKKYLLRLINTSIDNQIRVSLDNHTLTVVAGDMVPVQPVAKQWILLAIGQRYEVIINADQVPGNYWFRAEAAGNCASNNGFYGRAIFSYKSAVSGDPTSTSFPEPDANAVCEDEQNLTAVVPNMVPSTDFQSQVKALNVSIDQEQVVTNNQSIVVWGINMEGIDINWEIPTLEYIKKGNTSYPETINLIEIPQGQQWTYWIIQSVNNGPPPGGAPPGGGPPPGGGAGGPPPGGAPPGIPHPMHLHGHDFYVLGHGTGVFDPQANASSLNFNNPYRRDVTMLPGNGWLVVAFPTDNPGAWLMHCHIAAHISEGLGVQFLERKSEINLPGAAWERTCKNWKTFYDGQHPYSKLGSGL